MAFHALEYIEVACLMVRLHGDGAFGVRIPDDNISIGTLGDAALLRIQIEYFSCIRAGDGHKSIWADDAGMHALFPGDRQPVFDAIHSVGDFREITLTQGLLLAIECAMIAAGCLKMVPGQR